VTSVEIPFSIAAALPTLSVVDITNDVAHVVAASELGDGIAYVSAGAERSLVRINERESGFFCDLEDMLIRLVPIETPDRERAIEMLLGPRTEQVPFVDRHLCLGQYQRIFLVGFGTHFRGDWTLTLLG
jgi:thiamine phosphate synthase YjbQ (UPF0047 family)